MQQLSKYFTSDRTRFMPYERGWHATHRGPAAAEQQEVAVRGQPDVIGA